MRKRTYTFFSFLIGCLLSPGWSLAGPPSECDLQAHWTALATTDPAKAEQAILALVSNPGPAVGFLGKRLRAVPWPDAQEVANWIADLDSDQFRVREKATNQLRELGESSEPVLRRALVQRDSFEVRRRIESLLQSFKQDRLYPSPERRRMARAMEVLERIGDQDACRLLDALARGAPDDSFTLDAQGAQDRLKNRLNDGANNQAAKTRKRNARQ